MKKIELKVSINCQLCKRDVLKAVTKLVGIDEVFVDADKGNVTVIGEVDPILLVERLKCCGKKVELVSVGSPKPPTKPSKPTSEPSNLKPPKSSPPSLPPWCNHCHSVAVWYIPDDGRFCSIL